ncbi:MAG: formamidopyrimidine-DNA glycosylase [Candidatus Eremiobacteraeota bacterium]|nr:formamidopyrimidine-DNA glycosylase [Candidatus Eremiobacteraeota bacterium]
MPELPDVVAYVEALRERIVGQPLERVRVKSVALLRTADPPIISAYGRTVRAVDRIGKRIAIALDGDLWLIVHLMIAGRLHWRERAASLARRNDLAAFDFPNGTLTLTEAGTKRRASLSLVAGSDALRAIDRGGLDVLGASSDAFRAALSAENHTLKRALTDPRMVDGVGNAYSDEILHAAGLSPLALTGKLTDAQWGALYDATQTTLRSWIARLRDDSAGEFPEGVTAFRAEMAVHGRFRKPCPRCGTPIARIRYAEN